MKGGQGQGSIQGRLDMSAIAIARSIDVAVVIFGVDMEHSIVVGVVLLLPSNEFVGPLDDAFF